MSDFDDRDIELLSAYLDGALTEGEAAALETRLRADAALRADLAALRQTVALVRSLPRLAAPRSFALTAEQAGLTAARPRRVPIYLSSAVSALSAAAAVVLVALAGFLLLDAQAGALPAAAPLMMNMAAAPTSVAQAPAERLRITALPTLPPAASAQSFESAAGGARAVPPQPQAAEDSAAVSAPEAAVAQPQPTFAAALTATAPPEIALGAADAEVESDQLPEGAPAQAPVGEAEASAPAENLLTTVELSPAALLAGGLLLLLLAAATTLARGRARRRL